LCYTNGYYLQFGVVINAWGWPNLKLLSHGKCVISTMTTWPRTGVLNEITWHLGFFSSNKILIRSSFSFLEFWGYFKNTNMDWKFVFDILIKIQPPRFYTSPREVSRASLTPSISVLYLFCATLSLCHLSSVDADCGRRVIKASQCWPLVRHAHPSQHHFVNPYYNLARTPITAAVHWPSIKGGHISSIPYHLQTLPPIELYATFPSSAPLSEHTSHFRCLRHSSSIKLLPLSSPAMWRRVMLL
jgi:hypothetical protein